jgi:tRNA(Ile)-lysidine synthase
MRLVKTIQNFAFQNNLWERSAKIIVGVSGGPDSTCLLDVLDLLSKKYDFHIRVAHVNYQLRGKDSDADEAFVIKLAEKYGMEASVLRPKKSTYAKGNMENSLRDIRYAFFERLRKENEYGYIAVAHNQDDQAETVLMRILRGSGLNGLSAMKPRSGSVIRPLLGTTRGEIIAYLKEKKLAYRIDKSNEDLSLMRNKVRRKLIPFLEKEFNSSIKKTLSNWSLSVADDYAFIAKNAERFVNSACNNKCATLVAGDFLKIHGSIQRHILREIIKKLKGMTDDIESSHVEELLKIIKSGKNKTQKASIAGLKILKKGDIVEIFH